MASNAYAHHDGRIRQPIPTSGPTLSFDLFREIHRLQSEQPWQAEHTANTIVKYPDLRIVLIALKAGGRLHEHKTSGRISIQTLSGLLRIDTPGNIIEMPAGTLTTIDQELAHDVVAVADSVFLLTIAWPEHRIARRYEKSRTTRNGETSETDVVPIDHMRIEREKGLDQTLAQTFPCSDALSTDPNPSVLNFNFDPNRDS